MPWDLPSQSERNSVLAVLCTVPHTFSSGHMLFLVISTAIIVVGLYSQIEKLEAIRQPSEVIRHGLKDDGSETTQELSR